MPFNGEKGKSLAMSTTFWGVLVSVVAVFSDDLGLRLGENVENIITVLGGLFAMWGRFRATQQITGVIVPDDKPATPLIS